MTDGASEADIEVIEEVEALEATLLEGIRIRRGIEGSERPTDLELVMTPLTASDEERAFVSLTLKLSIPLGYPRERPSIVIAHPRGLGESGISSLEKGLAKKCRDNLGDPILYQLVEYTQEFLTESNVPACSCAVCLCDLKKEDSFIKTPCYHYFHSLCYGSYIQNEISNRKAEEEEKQEQTTRDLRCPVCREILVQDVLNYDFSHFLKSPPPVVQVPESFTLTEDLKELQNSMKNLFEKQKLNGAIIDIEAENSMTVLSIGENTERNELPLPSPSTHSLPQVSNGNNNNINKVKFKSKRTPNVVPSTSSSSDVSRSENPRRLARYKKYHSHNISRHQMHKNMKASKSGNDTPEPGNL